MYQFFFKRQLQKWKDPLPLLHLYSMQKRHLLSPRVHLVPFWSGARRRWPHSWRSLRTWRRPPAWWPTVCWTPGPGSDTWTVGRYAIREWKSCDTFTLIPVGSCHAKNFPFRIRTHKRIPRSGFHFIARIRIKSRAVDLDPHSLSLLDPDPYSICGSGTRSKREILKIRYR